MRNTSCSGQYLYTNEYVYIIMKNQQEGVILCLKEIKNTLCTRTLFSKKRSDIVKKIRNLTLNLILLAGLGFLINTHQVNAQVQTYENKEITPQAQSVFVRKVVRYDRKNYTGTSFPKRIWVSNSAGYAGYIMEEHWEIGPTHIVVTYSGNIFKGPYAPNVIEDKEN